MSWGVDKSYSHLSKSELFPVLEFPHLELVGSSQGLRPHDDRDAKLVMAGDEVGMIVGEQHKLEAGVSFGDEVGVGFVVEEGIDDEALLVGLDVVGEDGELGCLELRDVVVITCEFADQRIGSVHFCFYYYSFPTSRL